MSRKEVSHINFENKIKNNSKEAILIVKTEKMPLQDKGYKGTIKRTLPRIIRCSKCQLTGQQMSKEMSKILWLAWT